MPALQKHNIAFGRALREFREKLEKTQAEIADQADPKLDRTFISLLELGQRSPTLNTQFALCVALQISYLEFATRTAEIYGTLVKKKRKRKTAPDPVPQ